jgi:adenosylcobinamide-GDP ribazoletransferase
VKHFLIALQFLTVFPVTIKEKLDKEDFGKALVYFPLTGLLIGSLLYFFLMISGFLPNPVRAAIMLIIPIIITGGLHLDGFSDTCDGFYGGGGKEKILGIMRDPRTGPMGVIGLISLLLLKFTLFLSVTQNMMWKLLILTPLFARWAQVLACHMSNYAREEGKAGYFIRYSGEKEIFIAGSYTFALFLLLTGFKGVILFAILTIPVILFIRWSKKKIGGMTGDTIGALSEGMEVLVLLMGIIFFE